MDAATALKRLTYYAEIRIEDDEKARRELAAALANEPATELSAQIESALTASAIAKPWRQLMKRMERYGVRDGLILEQGNAVDSLLSHGMTMSTSPVRTAAWFAEQEGLRRFLSDIDGIEVDEDEPASDDARIHNAVFASAVHGTWKETNLGAITEVNGAGYTWTVNLPHSERDDQGQKIPAKARITGRSGFGGDEFLDIEATVTQTVAIVDAVMATRRNR